MLVLRQAQRFALAGQEGVQPTGVSEIVAIPLEEAGQLARMGSGLAKMHTRLF